MAIEWRRCLTCEACGASRVATPEELGVGGAAELPERCWNRECRSKQWNRSKDVPRLTGVAGMLANVGQVEAKVLRSSAEIVAAEKCPRCAGPLVQWGLTQVRCQKEAVNFPLSRFETVGA